MFIQACLSFSTYFHVASEWFSTRRRARVERRQTALRGRVTAPSGEATVATRATPQKPLRADRPVTQSAWLDPRRVTASAGVSAKESRPSSGVAPAADRIGQLVIDSVVGPHR